MAGFVLGIGVVFLYYVVMYTAEALTKGGWLPADLSRWTPNVILGPDRHRGARLAGQVGRGPLPPPAPPLDSPPGAPGRRRSPGRPPTATGRKVVVVVRVPRLGMPTPDHPRPLRLRPVPPRGRARVRAACWPSSTSRRSSTVRPTCSRDRRPASCCCSTSGTRRPSSSTGCCRSPCCSATLVTVGLLTKNSELTVMRACGISLYRTAAPLLVLALVASGVLFSLEESILAVAHRQADAIDRTIRGRPPRTMTVANRTWLVGRNGDIYHYALYDPASRGLYDLNIYRFDAAGRPPRQPDDGPARGVRRRGGRRCRAGRGATRGPARSCPPRPSASRSAR